MLGGHDPAGVSSGEAAKDGLFGRAAFPRCVPRRSFPGLLDSKFDRPSEGDHGGAECGLFVGLGGELVLELLKAEILLLDNSLAAVRGFEVREAGGGRHC